MKGFDTLISLVLVFGGVVAGIALFQTGWAVAVILTLIALLATSARIQGHCDFACGPVPAARRIELWPLIQLPVGAVLTVVSLLVATSDIANGLFGGASDPATSTRINETFGTALGVVLTGMFAYFAGKDGAKLGSAHAFKVAIATLRFPQNSRGSQTQHRPSIDGHCGTVGWDFESRRIRARIAAEEWAKIGRT